MNTPFYMNTPITPGTKQALSARNNLMPRTYKPGKKPSPSGLPCRRCGATESSSWHGAESRLCATRKTGCMDEAAAEAACRRAAALPIVTAAMPMPAAVVSAAVPIAAPVFGLPMAAPPITVACAHEQPAMAVSLAAPVPHVPMAAPPVAIAPFVPAAGTKRAAPRAPLGAVDGNAPPAKKREQGAARAAADEPELSAYERQRLENIARNAATLRELGLDADGVQGLRAPPRPPPKPRGPPKPPPPTSRTSRSATQAAGAAAPAAVAAAPAPVPNHNLRTIVLSLFESHERRLITTVCKATGLSLDELRPRLVMMDILTDPAIGTPTHFKDYRHVE